MIKPVKVLCIYKFWARLAGIPHSFSGGIIIKCYSYKDVERKFYREMSRNFNEKTEFFGIGNKPIIFELFSYLPENGKKHFNSYR